MNEVLKLINKGRHGFKLGNIISCEPLADKLEFMPWENDAIAHCQTTHRDKWIKANGANTIFSLGKIPLRELTEFSGIQSEKQSISHLRGYPIKTKWGWVIPSYSPSFIRQGKPSYTHYLLADLQKAFLVQEHGWHVSQFDFIEKPNRQDIRDFYYKTKELGEERPTFYDIETTDSADTEEDERQGIQSNTILTIQFSIERNKAINVKWNEENMPFIKLMLGLPNWKVGFNSYNFDDPRIRDKGIEIKGKRLDLMWMFKQSNPGLELGLQKVASLFDYPEPWKHLSNVRPEYYGCSDVNAYAYIFPVLRKMMEKEGTWGNF